jgi:hypothetical protein
VDSRYARLLAEDLGCKESVARTCFLHEPCKRALGVVAWCHEHAPHDAERRARMALMWARKRRAGAFTEDAGERAFEEAAGRLKPEDLTRQLSELLLRYWTEDPSRLSELLDAVERNLNGNGRS